MVSLWPPSASRKSSVPGGEPVYGRFCKCGQNISNMKQYKVKQHVESDLHECWMDWEEHRYNTKTKKQTQAVKKRREMGACGDYDTARLANDKAEGYSRHYDWWRNWLLNASAGESSKKATSDHRQTGKRLTRVSIDGKLLNG